MRTFSIMETQHNLSQVLRVVESGQKVGITRRKHLVAQIVPVQEAVEFPDFVERARMAWSGRWKGIASEALLDESRGER
jgi:antitoxin (DNA-binding transcriptional repressor) of toxin-antitoxin stability system